MCDDYREYDDDPVHNSWVDYCYTQHTGERPYLYQDSSASPEHCKIEQTKAKIVQLQASIDIYEQKISQLEQLRAKAPSAEIANRYSTHIRNIRDMQVRAVHSLEKHRQELDRQKQEQSPECNDAFILYMIFVAAVIAFVIYLLF